MSTPKYLALVTASRTWPWSIYLVLKGALEEVTCTTWHLEGLNSMSHFNSYAWCLSKSLCKQSLSRLESRVRYMAVSSEKRRACEIMSWGRKENRPQDWALRNSWCHRDRFRMVTINNDSLSTIAPKCLNPTQDRTSYTIRSKEISNDQELIQSDPTSCSQNQKGNN